MIGRCANVADSRFNGNTGAVMRATGGLEHLLPEGVAAQKSVADDGWVVTAPVGSFEGNTWGLHDMAGNVAEWTRSLPLEYPYAEGDGRNAVNAGGRRVVRGGSFFDPPASCRPSQRLDYPGWQRVFNVGFRVVCEDN